MKSFKGLAIILLTAAVLVACGVEPAIEIEEPTTPPVETPEESPGSDLEDDMINQDEAETNGGIETDDEMNDDTDTEDDREQ